jgi:hypothetical protein
MPQNETDNSLTPQRISKIQQTTLSDTMSAMIIVSMSCGEIKLKRRLQHVNAITDHSGAKLPVDGTTERWRAVIKPSVTG